MVNQQVTPIVLVTRGRHDLLAATLTSLSFSLLDGPSYALLHIYQDDVSPYLTPDGLARRAAITLTKSGVKLFAWQKKDRSVAACRASAIYRARLEFDARYVAMIDGDILFNGDPIGSALDEIKRDEKCAAVGWSVLETSNARKFPDYDLSLFESPDDYLQQHKHVPNCDRHSTFHLYKETSLIDQVGTHAVWRVSTLGLSSGGEAPVLDMWSRWPQGMRCYDVTGSSQLRKSWPLKILGARHGFAWTTYNQLDAAEGYWTSDPMHPNKKT